MNKLRISTRLAGAFAALVLLIVALGALSSVLLADVQSRFDEVVQDRFVKITRFTEVKTNIDLGARAMRDALLSADTAAAEREIATVVKSRGVTSEILDQLKDQFRTPHGKELMSAVTESRAKYRAAQDAFLAQVKAGQNKDARETLAAQVQPAQVSYFKSVDEMTAYQGVQMQASSEAARAAIRQMLIATIVGVASAVLGASLMAFWIIRSITRPLARAVHASNAVAGGDLSLDLHDDGKDEVAQLLAAMNTMQGKLAEVVVSIQRGAESVATASSQISQGNNDLSGRTEEQASALEQTSASMRQLATTVKQNADSATKGNELAAQASQVAARGGEVVGEVVETMKGINESSRKIGDIIGVIDGIAFQTNILALNAAVEAARAGEQGRGFAVVAGEVRTLAQRSADAAREIKALIHTSVQRVEQGSALVDRAGTTMSEVVGSIREVSDLMGQISRASNEQSAGVAQIGEAVSQMDQATQQNAALVEQSAAAAESLKAQAHKLVNAVAIFRLGEGNAANSGALPAAA